MVSENLSLEVLVDNHHVVPPVVICSGFRVWLCWGLTYSPHICDSFWHWGHHCNWSTSSFIYLDIISPSLGCILESLKLSMQTVLVLGWWWGNCTASDCDVSGAYNWVPADRYCCSNSSCSLLCYLLCCFLLGVDFRRGQTGERERERAVIS